MLSGDDVYSMAGSLNTQTGAFSQTTTGSGTDTNFESGTNAGTPYTTGPTEGTTSFTSTETGDTRDGTVTLANSGTSRYDLLEQFNNTADGSNGGNGMADFSPVGNPIYVGRASVPSGMFSGVGDDQYQYCFAAGTLVLLADGTTRAIEKIEPGEMVLAAPENDPEAKPEPCKLLEVYHNAPAKLLAVTIASPLDPLNGEVIYTTAEHPFYVKGRGWTKARDLQHGDSPRTHDGSWSKIRSAAQTGRCEPVFNLHVCASHTYFVSMPGGITSVLVHNVSGFVAAGQKKVYTPNPMADTLILGTAGTAAQSNRAAPLQGRTILDAFMDAPGAPIVLNPVVKATAIGAGIVSGTAFALAGGIVAAPIVAGLTSSTVTLVAPAAATVVAVVSQNPEAANKILELGEDWGPTVESGSISYGALDELGRPSGVNATITQDMIGTGTPANPEINPPGWSGNGTLFNEARGHLLGAQLGGSGDIAENLVTLQQNPANTPIMRDFETSVRIAAENGETVNYFVTPIYDGTSLVPRGITLSASGSGGFDLDVTILNPAAQ